MHIYIFGSVCRGEMDMGSDIDLLACTNGEGTELDTQKFSIYTYSRINELWEEGNPFAWHLYLESKLVYSSDNNDFLQDLSSPSKYKNGLSDLKKFHQLFIISYKDIMKTVDSKTFLLSCIFLAIRNFATCYSLIIGFPSFSRRSPFLIAPKINIDKTTYSILTKARILSTRGYGDCLSQCEFSKAVNDLSCVDEWMLARIKEVSNE